jgi:L-alanine-DL-glutamate epimerase-like enolase superfamily enzyme
LLTATPLISGKVYENKSDVRITGIKTFRFKNNRGLFVKIETDEGTSGWGEASPNNSETTETFIHTGLKHLVTGQDPFQVEPLWDKMFWENHDLGPSGILPYAIAGVDNALWDLKGKLLNVPVYKLLGGKYRDKFKVYGGFGISGGRVAVDEAVKRAMRLAEKGFKVIKIRVQIRENNLNPDPDPTLLYTRAVQKALPDDVELFIDPNEGYTAHRAIQIGKILQDELGHRYFEAPCPQENNRDTREVAEALDLMVLTGEKCYNRWQFRDLILQANPDAINPDVTKAGGITEGKKIAALAQAFFKTIAPHNTKPTLCTAAALHLMASLSNFGPFIEFIETERYEEVMSVFDNHIEFRDGNLILPEGPGLGLHPDEKRLTNITIVK